MAYQNNAGRLSQVEKDKLAVTCTGLQDGCTGSRREHAITCAQISSRKALVAIVPGGKQRLNGHYGTMACKERKQAS